MAHTHTHSRCVRQIFRLFGLACSAVWCARARLFGLQRVFAGFSNNLMQPQVIYYIHFNAELLDERTNGSTAIRIQFRANNGQMPRAQKKKRKFIFLTRSEWLKKLRKYEAIWPGPFRMSFDTLPQAIWFAIFHKRNFLLNPERAEHETNEESGKQRLVRFRKLHGRRKSVEDCASISVSH